VAKKSGIALIVVGFTVALVTFSGFYLSRNPELISSWQYKRDSARKERLSQETLLSPESCRQVDRAIFALACQKIAEDDYDEGFDWRGGFSDAQFACMRDTFRVTEAFRLRYNGDPASHLENLEEDSAIVLHACIAKEELSYSSLDSNASDAKQMFDAWYHYKKTEQGNYFH
jgi:hypothetical protein